MEEYLELRTQLLNNSITYNDALKQLKKLPKPWQTKHWKEMRKKHLKDACENCGTSEPPLVIQHTKQPKRFSVHYQRIMDLYVNYEKIKAEVEEKYATEEKIEEFLQEKSVIRGSCPECGTINIRKNNKKNIYTCVKQHVFETPVDVLYYSNARTTDHAKAKKSAISYLIYINLSDTIKERRASHDLMVGKKALLLSFEEGIEYRQFKYIKTCCKRCAAVEDKIVPAYVLCEVCKENYHNPVYRTCYHCFGEAKDQ